MKEQKKRSRKQWFAIFLSVVFCFTLLPATVSAAGSKSQLDEITAAWNKTIYSQSNTYSNTKYQYSGAYQCQAFSRYIFNNLYGHTDGTGNKNNTVTITNHSTASSLLNQLKTVAKPGDAIRVTATAYGGSHIMHLYQVDSTDQIHVYESNYDGTTNKGRYYIYSNIATFLDNTMRLNKKKVTVSNDILSYNVELKIIHSNKNNNIDYAVIQDGIYTLTPKHASGMRLDVNGASKDNGANVQIYQSNNTDAQKFTFKHLGNGYYSITNVVSGKVVDVAGGHSKAGTNVQQWTFGNSSAQQWKLKDAGNGYYYLLPALNENLCLDVSNSGTANKTNVLVWTANKKDNQKWKLTAITVNTNQNTNNTVTTTAPVTKTYYVYNTDGTLVMRKGPGSSFAQTTLIPEGAAVTVTLSKNSGNWWYITYNGKSGYSYSSYLTTTAPTTKQIIKDGTYQLTPKHATNMRLDINGASKENGANAQIYKSNNTNAQKFTFKHLGDNYYSITCVASGKALDVNGGSSKKGTNVQQWNKNDSKAQKWKIESAGSGYYYLIPATNEALCLDVSGSGTKDKTNVLVWTNNKQNNQKWKIS